MTRTLAAVLLLLAAPLVAQPAAHTISPGMTKAQVIASLGEPLASRQMNEFTYVCYRNECTRASGMNDFVVLRSDSVVDAVVRSATRHYTGKSSSPSPISARAARSARCAAHGGWHTAASMVSRCRADSVFDGFALGVPGQGGCSFWPVSSGLRVAAQNPCLWRTSTWLPRMRADTGDVTW